MHPGGVPEPREIGPGPLADSAPERRNAPHSKRFATPDVFSSRGGHFGLIGMRERAERLGGELRLASNPGEGTEVEVTVPLP